MRISLPLIRHRRCRARARGSKQPRDYNEGRGRRDFGNARALFAAVEQGRGGGDRPQFINTYVGGGGGGK